MAVPKAVHYKKGNIEYISNIDRTKYNIAELTRAALKEVGVFLRKEMIKEFKKLPGMKRNKRIYRSTAYKVPYWKNNEAPRLQIGLKHDTWYGVNQEEGTRKMKRKGIVRGTTMANIEIIRTIESKYLKHVEDELLAQRIIDESEETSPEDRE